MTMATTAPLLKLGRLPSISSYRTEATTSYCPPTEVGIPKSVKARKKHWTKEAARVPVRGRSRVIQNVFRGLSPIILDTIMYFLSIYPMVL